MKINWFWIEPNFNLIPLNRMIVGWVIFDVLSNNLKKNYSLLKWWELSYILSNILWSFIPFICYEFSSVVPTPIFTLDIDQLYILSLDCVHFSFKIKMISAFSISDSKRLLWRKSACRSSVQGFGRCYLGRSSENESMIMIL